MLPEVLKFTLNEEEYQIRKESVWFFKENIFPRYKKRYFLINSKGEDIPITNWTDASYREMFSFVVNETTSRLVKHIGNLFTKLNPFRS